MDADALDPHRRRPAAPTRFQPKLKGRIKPDPNPVVKPDPNPIVKPDPEPAENASGSVKKEEPLDEVMTGAIVPVDQTGVAEDTVMLTAADDDPMEMEKQEAAVVEEEDTVLYEIDVFYSPALVDDTKLYVMQYPLRPSWRPYEMNERCEEVRLKPKQSKIEVDLSIVVDEENYLQDMAETLNYKKQTLSSSKAPLTTDYAVGVVLENQLHLNPIHAVLQLRHSKEYLNVAQRKKQAEKKIEKSSKPPVSQQENKVADGLNENTDEAEPWITLEYHAANSPLSGAYKQKMVTEVNDCIQFMMTPSDFVKSLCPGSSTGKQKKALPKWVFESLPLEEHIRKWLTECSQVARFNLLMHYSPPNSSDEDVLRVLQLYADLVQGVWVTKSSLVCEGKLACARDRVLFLFSESRTIPKSKLTDVLSINGSGPVLRPLVKERPHLNDYKFIADTDKSFEKNYPHIVAEEKRAWSAREKDIMKNLHASSASAVTKTALNPNRRGHASGKGDQDANRGKEVPSSSISTTSTTLSNEAREALPKALVKLFQQHKVLSLSSITRGLRDMALRKSSSRKDDQEKDTFVHAANGVSAHLPEVKSVISELAVDIHGLYVLKSADNMEISPLRDIVIRLFLEREPNAKLQKHDTVNAAKVSLGRVISDSEYNQVMNELCVNNRGSWTLKSGDMNMK